MSYPVRIKPQRYGHRDDLGHCYKWWINFIWSEIHPLSKLYDYDDFVVEREKVFRKYHLTQPELGSDDDTFIYFDSEECYTWFLLRWS